MNWRYRNISALTSVAATKQADNGVNELYQKPMTIGLLILAFATAAFVSVGDRATARPLPQQEITLVAAKKTLLTRHRSRPPEHIACTILGCHPTPPRCHPEMSYYANGLPTGFDVVVCR